MLSCDRLHKYASAGMHVVAEGVKISIVVCEPAEKREQGMPIACQIDAPIAAEVHTGLRRAVRRIECGGVVVA